MKFIVSFFIAIFIAISTFFQAQKIHGIQLFNPKTNDTTPVISMGEFLILSFDDLDNRTQTYRYTLKHYDRNWQDDHLFFTEFATGSLNAIIEEVSYSFNARKPYIHYQLQFPNSQIQPKISGNFEIIVYKDSPKQALLTRRFCMVETSANLQLQPERYLDSKNPYFNQRIQAQAVASNPEMIKNLNSITLNIFQNNDWNEGVLGIKPNSTFNNQMLFQSLDMVFAGNNEFYYFDNKNLLIPTDQVAKVFAENLDVETLLHPVWAYPNNYQYQPDANGAFFFRRNDNGIERDASTQASYSWVTFALDSEPFDKEIYVLGAFNNYQCTYENKMIYDATTKQYKARIYLKQGFYNYILATKDATGFVNKGEINGNFWQTENLYQGFLYYTPFGRNYDGLLGYGEFRPKVR